MSLPLPQGIRSPKRYYVSLFYLLKDDHQVLKVNQYRKILTAQEVVRGLRREGTRNPAFVIVMIATEMAGVLQCCHTICIKNGTVSIWCMFTSSFYLDPNLDVTTNKMLKVEQKTHVRTWTSFSKSIIELIQSCPKNGHLSVSPNLHWTYQ